MKRVLFSVCMLAAIAAGAQKIAADKVPAGVTTTFAKEFPKAQGVKWEQEHGGYEANFTGNGKKMSATFNAGGSLQETEQEIAVSELPKGIADYIAQNYKGQKIKDAAMLKMADGSTQYEAEVNKTDLVFDAAGKFIKAVKD